MGYLRQHMTPQALLGSLAFSAGLIDRKQAISARELAAVFTWEKLKKDAIYLDLSALL